MVLKIAKQEFRSMVREGRFRIAVTFLSVLFVLSLFGAYDYYASLKRQHTEAANAAREQWSNQGDKNPHSAAHYGTFVFKPIYPLSYFDRGVDAYTGNTLFLEAHRSNQSKFMGAEDQGDFARLGTLTPAFVLSILMPLLIIILGYAAVAAERENGNLRLLLAQGVRLSNLFWGKSLALWGVVLLLALPFLLTGAGGLLISQAGIDHWWRYVCIVLLYFTYFGCFIHLTLLISAWAGRQNVALVGAFTAWAFACLIVPKATVNLAKQLHPSPGWHAYHAAIEEDLSNGVDGHDATGVYTQKLREATLKEYGVDSVQHLPFNWDGFIMQKGEEHETYVYQKHQAKLLYVYQRQREVHNAASVLSPFLLINSISQRLAGTDVDVYFDFLASAETYRVQLVGELNGELTENFEYGDWNGTRGKDFFTTNSQFDYQPPTLDTLMKSLARPIGAMCIWLITSALIAILYFKKLKPV